jgi:hypothetical protein
MRTLRVLFTLAIILSFGFAFAAEKDIFRFTDPRGDDNGDGTFIYPTQGDLRPGDLDIVSFSAHSEKVGTQFEIEFAKSIDRPDSRAIDAGGQTLDAVARYGFWKFNVDIYIDKDRKAGSGSTVTLPGRNALIKPEFAWERVICLTPRPIQARNVLGKQLRKMLEDKLEKQKGRVDPEDAPEITNDAYNLGASYYFPDRIRVMSRNISFFVPSSFLGGEAQPGWSYVVLVTAAVVENRLNFGNFLGSDIPTTLMNLPIKDGAWSDRFGTTRNDATLLPPVADMLIPEGMTQEDVLHDFDVNAKRQVSLPGVTAGTVPPAAAASTPAAAPVPSADLSGRITPDIAERLKQFPRTEIDYDRTLLDDGEKRVLAKLIEASRDIDDIFWVQSAEENPKTREQLSKDATTSLQMTEALQYFNLMKGRWDRLKGEEPFVAPFGAAGKKPLGAGFYPADMTKEEFEQWIKEHPEDTARFMDLFTVIRRQEGKLVAVPYSEAYADSLKRAARELKEAAEMTGNASLRDYLNKRADSFLSNDYFESDIAWMNIDSPIEPVIGPYEVYEDNLFNYKAAFESFICVVDKPETEKLKAYLQHIPDMEKNLPIPDIHKNLTRGGDNSIRVVQEVFTAGDGRRGVQTAAFNLPNDEKVRTAKGFKNILLKNVIEAKFKKSGQPIAQRVLDPSLIPMLSADAFFNHTLFHELSHGVGPGLIVGPDGKKVETRLLLKDTYSTIEECKADVLGIWNLLYAMQQKWFTGFDEKTLHVTDVGLMFRGMRFGLNEAHGRGTAIQWNWYREKGAILPVKDGRYTIDFARMPEAVRSLANELLMIEAGGDYDRAKRLLDGYGKMTPELEKENALLKDIPVDIAPVFTAAGEK